VFIGSFWNQPLKVLQNEILFKDEMKDLLDELGKLPKLSAQRKVNELIKRAKLCRYNDRFFWN
jgi:hypothetical protein